MKHITLREMLEEIVKCIVKKEEIKNYYYKNNEGDYKKITSIDLLCRIEFEYDDFTEYEWERK